MPLQEGLQGGGDFGTRNKAFAVVTDKPRILCRIESPKAVTPTPAACREEKNALLTATCDLVKTMGRDISNNDKVLQYEQDNGDGFCCF